MIKNALLRAALLIALLFSPSALADQSSLCTDTSSVVSGLTLIQNVNAGLKALATTNSGTTAPTNDCSAATLTGQLWLDTSTTPNVLRIFDGTSSLAIGTVDAATHIFTPPVGGGADSVASAATTDLWSVAPNLVTVTGSTTITKLAGAGAVTGTHKTVVFGGALTLTYHATQLITPTGYSITTAAGATADVVALGGENVRIVSYTRPDGRALSNPNFTGDSGSGGVAGLVPAPTAGQAAKGYMLGAGGGFSSAIPIGGLIDYGGTSAPDTCWVFPYGEALSRTTYAALFAVLSTTYGVGDGSTTFNVMDLRGRVTAGQDDMGGTSANRLIDTGGFSLNGDTLGDTGGAETHTLTEAEMPSHTHSITKSFWHGTNGDGTAHPGWSDGDTGGGSVAFTTTSAGGDDPHDIVQPTIILNKLLRAC